MNCRLAVFLLVALSTPLAASDHRAIPVGPNPESVARGFDGDIFVTLMGETRRDGDGNGRIVRLHGDKVTAFSAGFDDPKGIVFTGEHLITADFTRVWKIDDRGNRILLAGPEDFPHPPAYLNDVALAPDGRSVLVTDMGAVTKMRNPGGQLWPADSAEAQAIPVIARVYRITLDGEVSVALAPSPAMLLPNGVSAPDPDTLLVAEFFSGNILEFRGGSSRVIASGHRSADAIARDSHGTHYVSEVFTGKVWAVSPAGKKSLLATLDSAADFLLDEPGGRLLVPDTKAGTIVAVPTAVPAWETVACNGQLHPRHEAAFVALGSKLYLLGGRRIQPADICDTATMTWTHGKAPPVETHHFQPVVWEGKIWLPGAMTGKFPHEKGLDQIPIYDPVTDSWSQGPALPADRQRGGAGAVIHDGKLYVICGIIDGHWSGHVNWLDVLDLKTGQWTRLPDAPRPRDHFQAAVIDGKIYVAGGRRSSAATKQVFDLTVAEVDIYDIAQGTWSTLPAATGNIPTQRAGTMSIEAGPLLLVAGGESITQGTAHDEIEFLDTRTGRWRLGSTFTRDRHGSAIARVGDTLYVASGSGNRGGSPELPTLEKLDLSKLSTVP